MNEPIKHHYIPQFILKNFSFDSKNHIHYYDKKTSKISIEETRNIFMSKHLYRDETNSPECPAKIEYDLASFENEIAKIIKGKFLKEHKIILNAEEDAKLRLFFAIMGFRSDKTKDFFANSSHKEFKKLYKCYQKNNNFEDLWKRNLGFIVTCRSMQEVIEHPKIDEPIKLFFIRDTLGITGMYFVVAERKDCEEFIIGDCYPVVITGQLPNGFPLHLYSVFPISPDRIILVMSNGAEYAPQQIRGFRQGIAMPPKTNENGTYTIIVKKLYGEEVEPINAVIYKNSKVGIIFRNNIDKYIVNNGGKL